MPELRWFALIVEGTVVSVERFDSVPTSSEFPGSPKISPTSTVSMREIEMSSMTAEEFESFVEVWDTKELAQGGAK